ncbi:MAG: DUF4123 domain-containing protein [Myxococcales bacterium]
MTPACAQVLAELGSPQPLYALLDGARDPRIRGWVLDTRAPAWCLYRGDLPPVLESAAPWLVRLVPGSAALDRFFARGWQDAWGILLACAAPSRELRRHLRRFLRARTEEGRILAFRYYDPRILRAYLPTCTPAEIAAFFGPVSAFVAEGEHAGSAHLFRRSKAGLESLVLQLSPTPAPARPQPRSGR